MKIKQIISQHRRDFQAIYICEHCGFEVTAAGYDDDNFHRVVVPGKACQKCGLKAPTNYRPLGTKYSADMVL